jgi:hypothetical protein
MPTRRQTMLALAALMGGTATYAAGSYARATSRYNEAVRNTWQHSKNKSIDGFPTINHELVRYATLAASSHNTQCWKFKIEDRLISILPDWTRRCPAVDPDDHHLFVSLGCATENLLQAAQAFGQKGTVQYNANSLQDGKSGRVNVTLESAPAITTPLFEAIPKRQCTRAEYDGRKLSNEDLKSLETAARGTGVNVLLITEPTQVEKILEYVVQGNTTQMDDRAFVDELEYWIRFSHDEVVNSGDGLFTGSSGNPIAPRWLGMQLLNLFFTAKSENDKYAKQIRSSAGIAIFVSDRSDREHWVKIGRSYERFALQATALGIKNAFLNQPVEVAVLRSQFATYLGISDRRPDLVVRFGYGPETPRSLRRPLEHVIIS